MDPPKNARILRLNTLFLKNIDRSLGSLLTQLLPHCNNSSQTLPVAPSFLFIRPGGIGDAVLLIPAIQALKLAYPDCRISILAETRNSMIFSLYPAVHSIYRYDKFRDFLACCRKRYTCIIDTEQYHRFSAVISRCIRSERKIGFTGNNRDKMFSDSVTYSHDNYEIYSFFRLLAPLGIQPPADIPNPFIKLPKKLIQTAQNLLTPSLSKPFVCIFPGASIEERKWGAKNFSQLVQLLNQAGLPVAIIGGKNDIATGERIMQGNTGINLAGKTSLIESIAIIDRSHLLISADSGMLHCGVGLGKKTVSLFGPGIAAKWAPQGKKHIVLNKHLPCSPCTRFGYTPKCQLKAKCIRKIKVEEVFRAAITS